MRIAALVISGLALISSLPASLFLYFLGSVFLGSHVSSDKRIGYIALLLIPVFLGLAGLSVRWSGWQQGWRFGVGFALGGGLLVLFVLMCVFLPGAIESAARP